MRRMFADVEADIYVLVDGDATYHAESSPQMIDLLLAEGLDMVVGRRESIEEYSYRLGHRLGNRMLTGFVARLFGRRFNMLSGYRVFSRRYVKSFALARGFETETELTVHALELRMPVAEVDTPYKARPEGSFSKLNTIRDGLRILNTIVRLFRLFLERPLLFFSLISALLALLAVALVVPLAVTYVETGLVPRLPTAVLATGLGASVQPVPDLRPHP